MTDVAVVFGTGGVRDGRALVVALALLLAFTALGAALAQEGRPDPVRGARIVGALVDGQGQPVAGADVALELPGLAEPAAHASSQADGSFQLAAAEIREGAVLTIHRAHFAPFEREVAAAEVAALAAGGSLALEPLQLQRAITAAFWLASAVFVVVLVLIATGWLHNTLASLLGVGLLFALSYLGVLLSPQLFVFDFATALGFVDWNVIFLILGMMMVIAVVEHTGIFQWLAFAAYRGSRGRLPVLMIVLVLIASVGSAILDNVTTMLLMTPITVRIALAIRVNPLALLMPTVMASNVAGVSTLVGTPTNILIGSFGGLGFNDFLINLTPGALLALAGLIVASLITYRRELAGGSGVSPQLLEKLREGARITEPANLRKAGWVGLGMLVLFVMGEGIHLPPAVTAMMGATALLVWVRPDIESLIKTVDWTTLVFFITLFMVVGAIQEVGVIAQIAVILAGLVGDSLLLSMLVVIWSGALLSTVIANIPFTAAMLPVVGFLTGTVPGAEGGALYYSLSVGSAMGGNGSLIGASANMVTAGISERAGYPISYGYFLRKGFPILLVTVSLATGWLLLRFLVLGGGA
jgi:Na+/H+ antiporter NhaD/arsenite permease-like protein